MSDVYQKVISGNPIVQGRSIIHTAKNTVQKYSDGGVKTDDIPASGGGGKHDIRWDDVRYYSGDTAS